MTQAAGSSFDRLKEVYSEVTQTYKNQPPGKMGGHIIQKWLATTPRPATKATQKTGKNTIPKEIPKELKLTLSQEFQVLNSEIEASDTKLAKLRRQRYSIVENLGRKDLQPCFDDLKELLEAHTELNTLLSEAVDAKTKLQLSGFNAEVLKEAHPKNTRILVAIDRLEKAIQKFPAAKNNLDNLLEKAQEAHRITQEREPENIKADKLYEKQELLWSIRRCLNLWRQQVQTPEVAASQFAERVRKSVDVLYDAIHPNKGNPPSTFRDLFQNARNGKTTPYSGDFSNFINMIKEFVMWLCRGLEFGFREKFPKRSDETEVELTDMHRASPEEKTKEIGNKLFEIATNEMNDFNKLERGNIKRTAKSTLHRAAIEIASFQFSGKKGLEDILSKIVKKKNEIDRLEEKDESTEKAKQELKKLREQSRKFGLDETSFEIQENLFAAFDTIRTTYQQQHKKK
jgi:hypothetical protein